MLGQMVTQLAEVRRAELLAEATSHRLASTRPTPSASPFNRLAAFVRHRRDRVERDRDLDVAAACCGATA